jgi:serine/threonine-protein kinase
MSDDARIMQLLEEALDSKRAPEEVCVDFPELLPEVRQRLKQCQEVDAQFEAMFPLSGLSSAGGRRSVGGSTALPEIPGYEVEAVLGHGGMGVVYKARHLKLNRTVALKMLLSGAFAGRVELARFMREAEAVASLRHANIVQVHDVGDLEGRPYFTMEFVEGGNLAEKLAGVPQPANEAAALLVTLASAVQVAHQGGLVHRDLKPANILLTTDGTPKISDFGLARRFEGGALLTGSGARVGTPSYMAPEQAIGKADTVGPPVDIYSLGAILYEMLTGRPPFKGETAAETERQLIAEEPVPPSRLNAKVPRDLETICLKCLHKDPARRYVSASALAEDLRHFQRGETITARPAGLLECGAKWVRRRPAMAVALGGSAILAMALVGVALWRISERQATKRALETDLTEVAKFEQRSSWAEASAALERAEVRLADWGLVDLRRRVDQARRDLELVAELDAIRLARAVSTGGIISVLKSDAAYEAAFHKAGLGELQDDPQVVASRIKASNIRRALLDALDDWIASTSSQRRLNWLVAVARRADPDHAVWRDHLRNSVAATNPAPLVEVMRTARVADQPISMLLMLGQRVQQNGGDAIPFLTRVQQAHPDDFWANLVLGEELKPTNPKEAVRYFQAAVAIRPGAAVAYNDLGGALWHCDRPDEALAQYRRAAQIDPSGAPAQNNICLVLWFTGRHAEAIEQFRQAIPLNPKEARMHAMFGDSLEAVGRHDEAIEQDQQALSLDPKFLSTQIALRHLLIPRGRAEEAHLTWKKALDTNPPEHEWWNGYAEFCLFLGHEQEYRGVCHALLDRFGKSTDPHVAERTGRACLLLPVKGDELQKACALIDRAVTVDKSKVEPWAPPYFLFAKGLAEYRQGRMESAISIMQGEASCVLGPAPRLVTAMAQQRLGQNQEARKTLAAAILAFNWSSANADGQDAWIYHVLRREAEGMILPDIPAFLEGEYQPQDDIERLALLEICQFKDLRVARAHLYADVLISAPALAGEFHVPLRYSAACAAAAAGCGMGKDAAKLNELERARCRGRALEWLRADLNGWSKKLEADSKTVRPLKNALSPWRSEPDLSGIRDKDGLDKLSPAERAEWQRLWSDFDTLLARVQKLN